MGTARYTFNTNFNNEVRLGFKLSINEYLVALFIQEQMLNPESALSGWCFASKEQIAKYLGLSRRTIQTILKKLNEKGLIVKFQESRFIRTTNKFYMSQNCIPSAQTAQGVQILHSYSKEKVTPKEININTHSQNTSYSSSGGLAKKPPSCPLLNGSPLKAKYPKGHNECVEYILGIEEARGRKFINLSKQYQILHRTLKAGYDFTELDKAITAAEKKYGEWNFDLTTLAAFLEKGINART